MNTKKRQLLVSWIIALCAIYVAFSIDILLALLVAFPVVIFRDTVNEKKFYQVFMERNKALTLKAKKYAFIVSIGIFLYVMYSLMKGEYEYLSNYRLIGGWLLAILWPFVGIAAGYEISLYRSYDDGKR